MLTWRCEHRYTRCAAFPWQQWQQHVGQIWTCAVAVVAAAAVSEDDGWEGRSPICRAKAEICCPDTACRQPSHSGHGDWRSEAQQCKRRINAQEMSFATDSAWPWIIFSFSFFFFFTFYQWVWHNFSFFSVFLCCFQSSFPSIFSPLSTANI